MRSAGPATRHPPGTVPGRGRGGRSIESSDIAPSRREDQYMGKDEKVMYCIDINV
jgi:hypothetical protein